MTRRTRLLVGMVLGGGVGCAGALTWMGVRDLVLVKPPVIVVDLQGPAGGKVTGELSVTPRWDADPKVEQVEWAIPSTHRFTATAVGLDWSTQGEVAVEMTIEDPDESNHSKIAFKGAADLTDAQRLLVRGSSDQNIETSKRAPRLRWPPLVAAAFALLFVAGALRLLPWLDRRRRALLEEEDPADQAAA